MLLFMVLLSYMVYWYWCIATNHAVVVTVVGIVISHVVVVCVIVVVRVYIVMLSMPVLRYWLLCIMD